ncbi:4587_t:CDS:2, partial [Dentiscutata heterogama]
SENFIIFHIAITIFRIVTVTAFVFTDAKAIQVLYIPSIQPSSSTFNIIYGEG